jgi:hypothetical protein
VASAWESRVNAQQSRAGSEGREPTPPCTVNLGSVELSIDPPPTTSAVLNLSIGCCQRCCPTRRRCCPHGVRVVSFAAASGSLGGLLIKISGRLREFDGEEGLDAGIQIEGFAGPAGSDGLGVGMLEAVHSSKLIMRVCR